MSCLPCFFFNFHYAIFTLTSCFFMDFLTFSVLNMSNRPLWNYFNMHTHYTYPPFSSFNLLSLYRIAPHMWKYATRISFYLLSYIWIHQICVKRLWHEISLAGENDIIPYINNYNFSECAVFVFSSFSIIFNVL